MAVLCDWQELYAVYIYMLQFNLAKKPDKRHDWLFYATGKNYMPFIYAIFHKIYDKYPETSSFRMNTL